LPDRAYRQTRQAEFTGISLFAVIGIPFAAAWIVAVDRHPLLGMYMLKSGGLADERQRL